MASATTYPIECACGRSVSVGPASAGGIADCICGRQLKVPKLSELRLTAGQKAFDQGALSKVRRMLADNQLPGVDVCLISMRPTRDLLWVDLVCETPYRRGGHSWWMAAVLAFCSPLLYWIAYQDEGEIVGRDTVVRLPIPVCLELQEQTRRTSSARIIRLLGQVPEYRALINDFPGATASVVATPTTPILG